MNSSLFYVVKPLNEQAIDGPFYHGNPSKEAITQMEFDL